MRSSLALLAAALLAGCAAADAPVCHPLFSWTGPAYGCGAGAATAAATPIDTTTDAPPPPPPPTVEEPTLVRLGDDKIELLQPIQFETGSPRLLSASRPLLEQVVQVMFDHPEIQKIRIEGHTDAQGNKAKNLKLSQARAEAVRDFLADRGVDKERMEAKGFGSTRPVADNRTPGGRDANRRVELVIVHRGP